MSSLTACWTKLIEKLENQNKISVQIKFLFFFYSISCGSKGILCTFKINGTFGKILPTSICLIMLPFLIKPIDDFVEDVMNKTYRKLSARQSK